MFEILLDGILGLGLGKMGGEGFILRGLSHCTRQFSNLQLHCHHTEMFAQNIIS